MSEDRFLQRWSRRKHEARETPLVEAARDAPVEPEFRVPAEPETEVTAEDIAALPPVESVMDAAGLRQFLRRGIPAGLRHAALRRLWRLDPKIRDHVDAAQDYAFDWNAPDGVPGGGGTVTREQVAGILDRLFPPTRLPGQPDLEDPWSLSVKSTGIPEAETIDDATVDAPAPPAEPVVRESIETRAAPQSPRSRHGSATPS